MAKKRKRKTARTDGRIERTFMFDGRRIHIYGSSKQDLDRKEYEKRLQLESGKKNREDPTITDYYEIWTDNRRGIVKESTIHSQKCQFHNAANIIIDSAGRRFGKMRLSEIKTDDVREVQRKLLLFGHTTQTVNDIIAHLKHVFKTAVNERRIDFNPCTLVKPLKRTEERARDTIHRALTEKETRAFLTAAAGSYYYDVYRMALNTGMRIGEIGALLTDDIKDDLITVERTITRLENGSYQIGESAKTEAGRRVIPVNDNIREILEHQTAINRAIDGYAIHDRIFKAPERGLLMSTPINRDIKVICAAAGIRYFTLHALRATFATRAIEQGINPRTIQEILGHSDFAITMNLYGHVLNQTKIDAMKKLVIAV